MQSLKTRICTPLCLQALFISHPILTASFRSAEKWYSTRRSVLNAKSLMPGSKTSGHGAFGLEESEHCKMVLPPGFEPGSLAVSVFPPALFLKGLLERPESLTARLQEPVNLVLFWILNAFKCLENAKHFHVFGVKNLFSEKGSLASPEGISRTANPLDLQILGT